MKHKRDCKKFIKAVGSKFYSLRKEQKKAVESVAKAVNISCALLMRIEKGDYDMHLDLLRKLCECYGIAPGDLFRYVEIELRIRTNKISKSSHDNFTQSTGSTK